MRLNILIFILILCGSVNVAIGQEVDGDSLLRAENVIEAPSSTPIGDELAAAEQAYRDQRYAESIALYESLIAQGEGEDKVSAQLYYNLGNAFFRDNQLGNAILSYERALLLAPGDGDIRHNLRFAQQRTVDRIDTASDLFLTNWFRGIRNVFSSTQWAVAGIILFIAFLVCVAIFLFVSIRWARKSAFYAGIVLFFLMITANVFGFSQKSERQRRNDAIVMVGAASVNASPDEGSKQLFELHEGSKVNIRNTDGGWYEIEIADGSVGWVRQQDFEVI